MFTANKFVIIFEVLFPSTANLFRSNFYRQWSCRGCEFFGTDCTVYRLPLYDCVNFFENLEVVNFFGSLDVWIFGGIDDVTKIPSWYIVQFLDNHTTYNHTMSTNL